MSNIHAHARSRDAAADWLAKSKPLTDMVVNGHQRRRIFDAFVAGWAAATAPESEAEVNEIVVSLVRDAIEAAGDSAPEEAAAIDAAQRIVAYLGAIHRGEQDLWGARFAAAGELIAEAAALFRSYEAHHREKVTAAIVARKEAEEAGREPDPLLDIVQLRAKAERNALAAARLEAWVAGEDRYPTNPAEALRQIAERMVDGESIKGVDHASFDAAAAKLAEPVIRADQIVPHSLGRAAVVLLGERLIKDMAGVALIEEGTGWVKVHGVRDAAALFNVLRLAKIAAEEGQPDEENPEASAEWFAGARWRTDGVADLAAFRITTGDPRFDPAGPVTINGFLYRPAKEDDDNG